MQITNAQTGAAVLPSSLGGASGIPISSLLPNGNPNPAALDLQLDIPVAPYHIPAGQAWLQIPGLSVADIGNSLDLNGCNIAVYGGMSKGLPLANPAQSGLLTKGQIFQAFGNWIGTHQTLDIIMMPASGTQDQPMNWVLNWPAGMPLSSALAATFSTTVPNAKQRIAVSPGLVLNHDEKGFYSTLTEFAAVIFRLSKSIITSPSYAGVSITYDGERVSALDNSSPLQPVQIAFQDMIGQPTWRKPQVIQVKCVMRADLDIGDVVTLPQALVTTTEQAYTRFQNKTTFSGNWVVQQLHHYGDFRQPSAESWCTVIDMYPQPN